MPRQSRRPAPPQDRPTPNNTSASDSSHGSDIELDLTLVGGVNADIWAALFAGEFRLARRCDTCGRWLTAHTSKAAGRGPSCAAKAVAR
jgi:hypothetical protein